MSLTDVSPVLARVYGIQPWDIEKMTNGEVRSFAEDLEKISDG